MIKLGKEKGKNVQEIDFLVINYTNQYILNIEVKKWIGIIKKGKPEDKDKSAVLKVKKQLEVIRDMLEDWFGTELKGSWKYVSALFCHEMEQNLNVRLL